MKPYLITLTMTLKINPKMDAMFNIIKNLISFLLDIN